MIQLSFEQKKSLGLKYVWDMLEPVTPFGAEIQKKQRFYAPNEISELRHELDAVEQVREMYSSQRAEMDELQHLLSGLKDVRGTLKNCRLSSLGEVELFQLNAFLLQSERIRTASEALAAYSQLDGMQLGAVSQPLKLLDPKCTGKLSFYVEDSRTPALMLIRKQKRELEERLHLCGIEEREDLMMQRSEAALREEEELARIYAHISEAMLPYLDVLEQNCRVFGRLDMLIQKARLANRLSAVKPHVGASGLYLKDAVLSQAADTLKADGRTFTPITASLKRGVTVLTGANMGGKSVAIKTVTVNICLALMGCFVPCTEAEVPMFDRIELINEDFSAVSGGLSSFGGEIVRFNEAAARLDTGLAFIAMDEFARGTNGDEGAAIVKAVVRWLNDKNAVTLLATHYDGAAEYAEAHYQVKGLKDFDFTSAMKNSSRKGREGVRLIAEHMDYGIFPVDKNTGCPRDAVDICRLLGMEPEILNYIGKIT